MKLFSSKKTWFWVTLVLALNCSVWAGVATNVVAGSWSSITTPSQTPDGTALGAAVGNGWLVEQVAYDSGFAAFDAGTVYQSTTIGPNESVPFKTFNLTGMNGASERTFYVRVCNASTASEATHYVNLGVVTTSGQISPSYTAPVYSTEDYSTPVILTYEGFSGTTTDEQAHGQWIAKPSSNALPTDIALDNADVAENLAVATLVGNLSTTDSDSGDTHSYTLVAGEGDTDNASFSIVGSQLQTAAVFDFETKNSYGIRVQTDDGNDTFEKTLSITVTDINESPTTTSETASITENASTTKFVLANDTDPDAGDVLSLVADSAIITSTTCGAVAITIDTATVSSTTSGAVTFDPGTDFEALAAGETATVTISYTVTDDDASNPLTAVSTLTITVTGVDSLAAVAWDGGSGSENDPYQIATGAQLAYLAQEVAAGNVAGDSYFKLTDDIVLNIWTDANSDGIVDEDELSNPNDTEGAPLAWTPIGDNNTQFAGIFDGDGHSVSGMYINTTDDYQGLFGSISGTVENTRVIDGYVSGDDYVGGIAGVNNGTVENCCYSGRVNGITRIGGIAGQNYGTVSNCYNAGVVSSSFSYVGGVVGYNNATVANCYNVGAVSSADYTGGVVGKNWGAVQACYNIGTVSGSGRVGGIVGQNKATSTTCYYDSTVCGAIGGIEGSDVVGQAEGKTTAEMQVAAPSDAIYTDWDTSVWSFAAGEYPQLAVFASDDSGDDTGANTAPVAVADAAATPENTPVETNVISNDTDADNDVLSLVADSATITSTTCGAVAITIDTATVSSTTSGAVTFDPGTDFDFLASGETATVTITYTVTDDDETAPLTATGALTITVTGTNDAPTAVADTATTPENESVITDVIANDSDLDGDSLSLVADSATITSTTCGAVTITIDTATVATTSSSAITFDPGTDFEALAEGETALVTINYTVTDDDASNPLTAVSTLTVTVTGTNDAPVAVADSAETGENTPVSKDVIANDTDPDGDGLSLVADSASITSMTYGETEIALDTAEVTQSGNVVSFEPGTDFDFLAVGDTATVVVSYTVTDDSSTPLTAAGTLTITVKGVNDAPSTTPVGPNLWDVSLVYGDTTITGYIDPVADTFTVTSWSASAAHLGLAETSLPLVFNAIDINNAPYDIAEDGGSTGFGSTWAFVWNGEVGTLDWVAATGTASSAVADGAYWDYGLAWGFNILTWSPNADTFSMMFDANGSGTCVAVTASVTSSQTAVRADEVTAAENSASANLYATLLANDSDIDAGDTLSIIGVITDNTLGLVTFDEATQSLVYDPAGQFEGVALGETGSDSFQYVVSDPQGATATVDVSVTITGANDEPTAHTDTASTTENQAVSVDVISNDKDPDTSDVLSLVADSATITSTTCGAVIISTPTATVATTSSSAITFDPGTDFDFLASGETATVVISYRMIDKRAATRVAAPTGYEGTLTITVTGENDTPVAVADTADTTENASVTTDVIVNDTDLDDSDVLSLVADSATITSTTCGAVAITIDTATVATTSSSAITFEPGTDFDFLATGETATVTITYTVTDESLVSRNAAPSATHTATGTLTITVTGTNDVPVAVADTASTTENESVTTDVIANDTDLDGTDVLSLVAGSATIESNSRTRLSQSGAAAVSQSGNEITFAPGTDYDYLAAGETATVVVSYRMTDESAVTRSVAPTGVEGTLTITITGTNDAPVAVADTAETGENTPVSKDVIVNDTDLDSSDVLSLVADSASITSMTYGETEIALDTAEVTQSGNAITFDPGTDFDFLAVGDTATVLVSYTVTDESLVSRGTASTVTHTDTGTLTITVTGVNDAPSTTPVGPNLWDVSLVYGDTTITGYVDPVADTFTVTSWSASAAHLGLAETSLPLVLNAVDTMVAAYDIAEDDWSTGFGSTWAFVWNNHVADLDWVDATGAASSAVSGSQWADFGLAWGVNLSNQSLSSTAFSMMFTSEGAYDCVTVTTSAESCQTAVRADEVTAAENSASANLYATLLANDSDIDAGDTLSIIGVITDNTLGLVTFDEATQSLVYDPAGQFEGVALGETGSDSFQYVVSDPQGATATVDVSVTITGANDEPTAHTDTASTTENQAVSVDVISNDKDPDTSDVLSLVADSATITSTTCGAVIISTPTATVATTSSSAITFDPGTDFDFLASGETATVVISYRMIDKRAATRVAAPTGYEGTLTITVTGENDTPVAVADTADTTENASVTTDVIVNDTDLDDSDVLSLVADSATITSTTSSAVTISIVTATVATTTSGAITFDPGTDFDCLATGETATVTVSYTVTDESLVSRNAGPSSTHTDTGTLTITVTGTNDAPVAGADTADTFENTPVETDVISNDTDPDKNDVLSLVAGSATITSGSRTRYMQSGTAASVSQSGNKITFDPGTDYDYLATDETATVVVSYRMTDENAVTRSVGPTGEEGTLTITVKGENDAPVAVADTADTGENTLVTTDVIANDTDLDDSDVLSLVADSASITSMTYGETEIALDTAEVTQSGNAISFEPGTDFDFLAVGDTATVLVSYTVTDESLVSRGTASTVTHTDTGTLTITVTGVNDAPSTTPVGPNLWDVSLVYGDTTITGYVDPVADTFTVTSWSASAAHLGLAETSLPLVLNAVDINNAPYDIAEDDWSTGFGSTWAFVWNYHVADLDWVDATGAASSAVSGSQWADFGLAWGVNLSNQSLSSTAFSMMFTSEGAYDCVTVTTSAESCQTAVRADEVTAAENSASANLYATLLANDSDIDAGDTLSIIGVITDNTLGLVTFDEATQSLVYDPAGQFEGVALGETGSDSFQYVVSDPQGATATVDVSVTITGANDEPTAHTDTASTTENQAVSVDVISNDKDPDTSDVLSLVADSATITSTTCGAVIISTPTATVATTSSSAITFDPGTDFDFLASGETATVVISYRVIDERAATRGTVPTGYEGTLTITVTGENDAPVAVADTAATTENANVATDVIVNDTDLDDSDVLSLVADSASISSMTLDSDNSDIAVSSATLSQSGNTVTFAPGTDFDFLATGETATVTVSYTVTDESLVSRNAAPSATHTATGTLTITVTGTNDVPVAVADTASTTENESVTTDVIANDTDLDGTDVLSLVAGSATIESNSRTRLSQSGAAAVSQSGNEITFAPGTDYDYLAAGETATVVVSYRMTDESAVTRSVAPTGVEGTLTITITGTNDAPVAIADTAETGENTPVSKDVIANDTDLDSSDVLSLVAGASISSMTLDSDNSDIAVSSATLSQSGNTVTFAPGTDFDFLATGETATVTVSYTVTDESVVSRNARPSATPTDTGTLTITVTGTNDAPVAVADTASTTENANVDKDVIANDTDLDGTDVLSLVANSAVISSMTCCTVDIPNDSAAVSQAGNEITFAPGTDFDFLATGETATVVVSYTVTDDDATVPLTANGTLTVTVTGTNDAPTAVADRADTTESTPVTQDVIANDTDPDATNVLSLMAGAVIESMTLDSDSSVIALSSASVSQSANEITFAPGTDFEFLAVGETATVVIAYTVTDNDTALTRTSGTATPLTDDGTLTVTVTGGNDAPTAVADTANTTENMPVTQDVIANDTDPDSSNVLSLATGAAIGSMTRDLDSSAISVVTASVSQSGNEITFAPGTDFDFLAIGETATVVITYTVFDDDATPLSDIGTLTVEVTGVNDAPVLTKPQGGVFSMLEITALDTENTGSALADLVGASITDVDSGAVSGIAVYAQNAGDGTWQYKIESSRRVAESTWTDFGPVAEDAALVLPIEARVRFVPAVMTAHSATFDFYAWDQTGLDRAATDVTVRGGATAFSADGAAVEQSVSPGSFTVIFAAGTNGSVQGTLEQDVLYGELSSEVQAVPNDGYLFSEWVTTGKVGIEDPNSSSAAATVYGAGTLTAQFVEEPVKTATVTVVATTGGTVSGLSSGVAFVGVPYTIKAIPDNGYRFVRWEVTGYGTLANASLASTTATFVEPNTGTTTGPATLTAVFAEISSETPQVTLTLAAGTGGSVDPVGATLVDQLVATSIQATAAAGYQFVRWHLEGSVTADDLDADDTTVTLAGDATVTAIFELVPSSKVTLTVTQSGTGTTNPGNGDYDLRPGERLKLRATAGDGYAFDGWSIDGTGQLSDVSSPTTTVTAGDGNATITAKFVANSENVLLTLLADTGGSTNPGEGVYKVVKDSRQAISAVAADGYHFVAWQAGANAVVKDTGAASTTVRVNGAATVTALFAEDETSVTLSMAQQSVDSSGTVVAEIGGSVNPGLGEHQTSLGASTEITATAAEGYEFASWSIEGEGAIDDVYATTTCVVLEADATVTAWFRLVAAPVDVVLAADAGGTINPGAGTYPTSIGQVVKLTAAANAGYHFTNWSVVSGTADLKNPGRATTTVMVQGAVTLKAWFEEDDETPVTLTIAKVSGGSTNPGAGAYALQSGDAQSLEANPSDGWHFAYWQVVGDADIEDAAAAETQITLTGDATATAVFAENSDVELQLTVASQSQSATRDAAPEATAGGSTNPGAGTYNATLGASQPLEAVAQPGYYFVKWTVVSGEAEIADIYAQTTSVVISSQAEIHAVFAKIDATASLSFAATGAGSTSRGLGETTVNLGQAMSVTAVPEAGNYFVRWETASANVTLSSATARTTYVTVSDATAATVTAVFAVIPTDSYLLTLAKSPSGGGTVSPGLGQRTLNDGVTIQISATAATGYTFTGWTVSGGASVTDATAAATQASVSASDGTVTATFLADSPLDQLNDLIADGAVDAADLSAVLTALGIANVDESLLEGYVAALTAIRDPKHSDLSFVDDADVLQALVDVVNAGLEAVVVRVYSGWNLLSSPYLGCSPASVFGNDLDETCYRYVDGAYNLEETSADMIPGYGYWVFLSNIDAAGAQVLFSGTDVDEDMKNLPIQDGWNLIGAFDVSEAERKVANYKYIGGHPFYWDAEQGIYESVVDGGCFELGRGYWGYIVDAEEVAELTLSDDLPFQLDYATGTVTVTVSGTFDQISVAMFDSTTHEIVLTPVLGTLSGPNNGVYEVTVTPSSLMETHEYFIELAPIKSGAQGQTTETRFYAATDTDNDRIVLVPEYSNATVSEATIVWSASAAVVSIAGTAGDPVEYRVDVQANGVFAIGEPQSTLVMGDDSLTIDLSNITEGSRCAVSVRLLDDATKTPLSGWKTFVGINQ
jgi:hypothetical protein